MGLEKRDSRTFATIIADGTIRVKVTETTPEAVKRTYELKDGTKGEKWELVYNSLSGVITDIQFRDGEFGRTLNVTVDDIILSMNIKSNYAEDFMKRLPAADLTKEVKLSPFKFKGDNGKELRGVAIRQDKKIIKNFFYNKEEQKNINGFPEIEGDRKNFDSDDWVVHFTKVRKFLQKYLEDNIINKLPESVASGKVNADVNTDDLNVEEMFD